MEGATAVVGRPHGTPPVQLYHLGGKALSAVVPLLDASHATVLEDSSLVSSDTNLAVSFKLHREHAASVVGLTFGAEALESLIFAHAPTEQLSPHSFYAKSHVEIALGHEALPPASPPPAPPPPAPQPPTPPPPSPPPVPLATPVDAPLPLLSPSPLPPSLPPSPMPSPSPSPSAPPRALPAVEPIQQLGLLDAIRGDTGSILLVALGACGTLVIVGILNCVWCCACRHTRTLSTSTSAAPAPTRGSQSRPSFFQRRSTYGRFQDGEIVGINLDDVIAPAPPAKGGMAAVQADGRPPPPLPPSNDSQGSLPDGWDEAADPSSGKVYYCNETSGQSSWTRPAR